MVYEMIQRQVSTANSQLEKGIGNLQHQDVRVVVFVAHEDALAGAPHAVLHIVLFQTLQSSQHRRILLWLRLLRPERVVREGI